MNHTCTKHYVDSESTPYSRVSTLVTVGAESCDACIACEISTKKHNAKADLYRMNLKIFDSQNPTLYKICPECTDAHRLDDEFCFQCRMDNCDHEHDPDEGGYCLNCDHHPNY